jgi:5-methylcytosine-specific restriction endonuclease McrA
MTPQPKKEIIRLTPAKMKKLQAEVLERDNFTCLITGMRTESPPHHIVYRSQGGSDIKENLATLHEMCHNEIHHGSLEKMTKVIKTYFSDKDIIEYFLLGLVAEREKERKNGNLQSM